MVMSSGNRGRESEEEFTQRDDSLNLSQAGKYRKVFSLWKQLQKVAENYELGQNCALLPLYSEDLGLQC